MLYMSEVPEHFSIEIALYIFIYEFIWGGATEGKRQSLLSQKARNSRQRIYKRKSREPVTRTKHRDEFPEPFHCNERPHAVMLPQWQFSCFAQSIQFYFFHLCIYMYTWITEQRTYTFAFLLFPDPLLLSLAWFEAAKTCTYPQISPSGRHFDPMVSTPRLN